MSEPTKAVFLSYASQDAEAARRICDSLRSGGVEVWFDADGGLEHGDEWDRKIRKQIKECVLFIAVISANTQAREEGYFRLEWDLAAERARTIASGVPFILPVVIDDTREPDALVPDRFRAVQWTKLKGGEVPPEVRARFLKLWSHRTGLLKSQAGSGAGAAPATPPAAAAPEKKSSIPLVPIALAVVALVGGGAWWFMRQPAPPPAAPAVATAATITAAKPAPAAAPLSEARQLLAKTGGLIDALDNSRDDYKLAEELIAQAKSKDPMDAEVWAAEAQLHQRYLIRGWDGSDARREAARAAAQRAIRLDPQSFEARFAQANLLADTGRDATEKERQLRELRRDRPTDQRVLRALAAVVDRLGRMDEAAAIADESAALPGGDPLALYNKSLGFWFAGRTVEAETAIQASLAQQPFAGALMVAGWYRLALHADLEGARNFIGRIEPGQMIEDRAAFFAFYLEYLAHRPDAAIARLHAVPRDWLTDFWFRGPKGWLVGDALEQGGRHDAAAIEWTAALKLVEQRLATSPNNASLIYNRACLLIRLGQREEAERQFALLLQMNVAVDIGSSGVFAKCHALLGHKAEAIQAIAAGLKGRSHAVIFPSGALRLDPVYDSLRDEPEFAKLIAEAEALEQATPAAAPKSDDTTTAPGKADDKSVAVLAFDNLSDDKANEYFSDGISEELINALGRVPGLTVKGRTSAFFFKGKNATAQEIAEKLSVNYLVRGSVRKAGDKVRITAQLSRAATDEVVWSSEPLERDLKDVFAVQEEIVKLIAQNLSLKLGASEERTAKSIDPEAFRLFLAGRAQAEKASNASMLNAVDFFQQAVAREPNYAEAWAQLARAHIQLARFGGLPLAAAFAAAQSAIARAVALAPDSPEVLVALGWVRRTAGWDLRGAEQAFRRALELRPNHADTLGDLAVVLFNFGRMDEALQLARRAVSLDPLNAGTQINLSQAFRQVDQFVEAEQAGRRALLLAPQGQKYHGFLSRALLDLKRYEEAEREANLETDELSRHYALGLLAAVRGQRTEALAHARTIETIAAARPGVTDYYPYAAYIYSRLGESDRAFAALERAREIRDTSIPWMKLNADLRPLHRDPRWPEFLRKVGLADDQLK